MQTPTHSLIALALLARRGENKKNWVILLGSLVPDIFIYVIWTYLTFIRGESQQRIWDELYFTPPVQLVGAVFNSAPLYLALALAGFAFRARRAGQILLAFSLAALIHLATDFPVHAEDAHLHFWPLSTWRFYSPLSYWDSAHYGNYFSVFEALLGLGLIAVLWQRFPRRRVQIVLGIFAVLYGLSLIARALFFFHAG